MATNIATINRDAHAVMDAVISAGDLGQLSQQELNAYYAHVCQSVGLNPLTRPFEYIKLQGKLVLYARRDAADQLRKLHGISLRIREQGASDGVYTVLVEAQDKHGRVDSDLGIVPFGGLQGEARANAILKAVTKAKRRVTLSICGLGLLDEMEIGAVQEAQRWEEPDEPAAHPQIHQEPARPASFWDRPSYTIPAKDSELPAWVDRLCRAIGDAPDLEALCKLRDDNQGTLDRLVIDNDKELFRRYEQSLEVRKGMLESEDAA